MAQPTAVVLAKGSPIHEKAEGDSAVITWQSGWTTKITKQDDQFKKPAFDKGKAEGPATGAKKVE